MVKVESGDYEQNDGCRFGAEAVSKPTYLFLAPLLEFPGDTVVQMALLQDGERLSNSGIFLRERSVYCAKPLRYGGC